MTSIFKNMEVRELYDSFCALVPVKRHDADSADYREVLGRTLRDYMTLMRLMRKENLLSDDNIREVGKTCDKLKDVVKSEYQGLHSTAFNQFSNLLRGDGNQPALGSSIRFFTLKANEIPLYRMRRIENRRNIKYTDMFHIPLNKRGIVDTNRYSAPGYPCLYLGTSIYACWEELGRPPMSQSMVSRLGNGRDLHLIDLRIPSQEQFSSNIIAYVRAFPLIMACSVRVKDSEAHFKPEYCIPQLMMEYVIKNNVNHLTKDPIAGIYYTSVFKNDDFGFSIDKLENIAIPVQSPLSSKKYCRKLCDFFMISQPTCDEMEQARTGGYGMNISTEGHTLRIVADVKRGDYELSSFGKLEKRLKDNSLFPLLPIEDK